MSDRSIGIVFSSEKEQYLSAMTKLLFQIRGFKGLSPAFGLPNAMLVKVIPRPSQGSARSCGSTRFSLH